MRRLYSEVTFKLDYYHKEGLPNKLAVAEPLLNGLSHFELLGQHKFLPYRLWFKNELSSYIGDILLNNSNRQAPFWNSSFLRSIVEEHINGRKNYIREINAVLTLEAVNRLLIQGSSEPRDTRQ